MVLIEMDMPEICGTCKLKDYHHSVCLVSGKKISSWAMHSGLPKPRWCPLIEVESYVAKEKGD